MTLPYELKLDRERNPWIPDLTLIVLLLILLRCCTGFFVSCDTLWHVKTGEWIWTHQEVPTHDPGYSISEEPIPWQDHEWLAQLLLYLVWEVGGFLGMRLLLGLVPALIFAIMYRCLRQKGVPPLTALAFVALAAGASAGHWLARPHLLGHLCLLASLYAWTRIQRRGWWVGLLLIQVVWANLHLSCMLQFVFVLAFSAEVVWENRGNRTELRKRLGQLAGLAVLLIIATCLNPQGWHLFEAPTAIAATQAGIHEWRPFDLTELACYLFVFYALVLIAAFWKNRRHLRASEPILFLATAVLAFKSVRHMSIFVLATLPAALRHLPVLASAASSRPPGHLRGWWERRNRTLHDMEQEVSGHYLTAAAWVLLMALSISSFHGIHPFKLWDGLNADRYPVAASDFLARQQINGKIFSAYGWGGYLIFRFGGASQVFIDGRADMYSQQRHSDYERIVHAASGWQELLRNYDVDIILSESTGVLSKHLRDQGDWDLVHSDPQALLFLRRDRFQEFFQTSPPREDVEKK